MAKQSKKFAFTTPILFGTKNQYKLEIEISGVGYYYAGSEPDEMYDYDIETITADGQDFTKIFELLRFDQDSRLESTIAEATMAHMQYLFSGECDMCQRELSAVERVESGDFSSDNLFEAIGIICRDYNNSLTLVTPVAAKQAS